MKKCTFIGGVHGVGKSSLAGVLCVVRSDLGIMIDPDKLTIQCGGDEYEGGKLAVERIERALKDGVNFTQETTLSGGYPKRLCKRAKEAGYYIRLYYVGLDTAEESIRRIRNRVERGGMIFPLRMLTPAFLTVLRMSSKFCHTAMKPSFSIMTMDLYLLQNIATGNFFLLEHIDQLGSVNF